jgi:hypothetical protein
MQRARALALALAALAVSLLVPTLARADAPVSPSPDAVDIGPQKEKPQDLPTPLRTPFRVGALAGVGFPRPVSFEAMTKLYDVVGIGAEYGFLPLPSVSIDGVAVSAWAVSADLRVFPFHGAFFLGLRGGYQRISASASDSSLSESATLSTWFLNPRLGFAWTFHSGFTVATEAGVQIPLTTSFDTTLPAPLALAIRDSTPVQTLSGALPTIDLLRLGFLF